MDLTDAALREGAEKALTRIHAKGDACSVPWHHLVIDDVTAAMITLRDATRAEQRENIEELRRQLLELTMAAPHVHRFAYSSGTTWVTGPPPDTALCMCGQTYAQVVAAIRAQAQ